MFFARYLLATAAVEMLGTLPQAKPIRTLRMRARRLRAARIKDIRSWHIAQLQQLDPTVDAVRWFRHRAEVRRWTRTYREHAYQDQEFASHLAV